LSNWLSVASPERYVADEDYVAGEVTIELFDFLPRLRASDRAGHLNPID
jgi:hypothetical protein